MSQRSGSVSLRQWIEGRARAGLPVYRREFFRLAAGAVAAGLAAQSGLAQQPGQRRQAASPDPRDHEDPKSLIVETWSEPWTWRPSDWPDSLMELNLVAFASQPAFASPGNPFIPVFSYNGSTPAPTIRMRGDETLRIRLRNTLGRNFGAMPIGPAPDLFETPQEPFLAAVCAMMEAEGLECDLNNPDFFIPFEVLAAHREDLFDLMDVDFLDCVYLSIPANAQHAAHTTNLHTHGLHVEPEFNPNGKPGDNIMLRVIPREDFEIRQAAEDPSLRVISELERVGETEFEHPLGDVQRAGRLANGGPKQPHPPGTHWYHPHAHGATHDQVASGMAGFLIVEGDVDDAINVRMTGVADPAPDVATGPFGYRERLILIQRVFVASLDIDSGPRRNQGRALSTTINGAAEPPVMFMRPGAVERWRILNGSVDGRGAKNFAVLEGRFVFDNGRLWRVVDREGTEPEFVPVSRREVEAAKAGIYQLSFDGITLVSVENGQAHYRIRDLSTQNGGTESPLDRDPAPGERPVNAMLRNLEDCFSDGESLRNALVRPNQVFLANANRADVLFKAPLDSAGRVYTLVAQEHLLQSDNYQQRLQLGVADGGPGFNRGNPAPVDVVVGYVRVTDERVPGGEFNVLSLNDVMPPVPPFLQPVGGDELRIPEEEAARRGVDAGNVRTRVISYSGIGPTDFPVIEVPNRFSREHTDLRGGLWEEINGARILFPPFSGTMAVNSDFDLAANPNPASPHKFGHKDDEPHPKALIETAEEWVVYNLSTTLWSHTDLERFPQPGSYLGRHFIGYPIGRAEGQTRFAEDPEFRITSKGADHPFHIHVNPCWVTRIEVPDENGQLHNVLPEPQWMDTVAIPRAGGRIVFRSRFTDYVGRWVNHCHILAHEDRGMMQMVEAVAGTEDANYHARPTPASHEMASEDVDRIYPRPSRELMYRQNLSFVDTHPMLGYQFPGFELEIPELDD